MAKFVLSAEAEADLHDIYSYGVTQHGERQADHYAQGLFSQFEMLANFPGMGVPFGLPGFDFQKFLYGQHLVVFSVIDNETIRIEFIVGAITDYTNNLSDRIGDK